MRIQIVGTFCANYLIGTVSECQDCDPGNDISESLGSGSVPNMQILLRAFNKKIY